MKYFGTDGIRGVVLKDLTPALLKKIARGIVKFYKVHNLKPVLLTGNDTRISSDFILTSISSTLLRYGIEVHNLGRCSSPCLANITKTHNYPLGMMISASHNPSEFNGIKFFNSLGEKISEQVEAEIETYMDKPLKLSPNFKTIADVSRLKHSYINFLKSINKADYPCIFDCACGGTCEICKTLFPKHKKINVHADGTNINREAGCTHIEFLRSICLKEHMLGFAYDGDGDRLIAVSENGTVVDGDKILYVLSKFYQRAGDCLVGTIYTNSGLEKSINKNRIELKRAGVGDKLVYQKMKEFGSFLGGENSGHIIFKHLTNTGDGILTAIVLMNILDLTKLSLDEILVDYSEYYQATKSLKLNSVFIMSEQLKQLIEKQEKLGARVIIRPSGTEPVLRLFVEHEDKPTAEKFLKEIENLIKN